MTYQKGIEQTVMYKLVDETDFATPETGATSSVELSLDSEAFTGATNTAVEVSNGWYKIVLTADEKDADEIILKVTAPGAAQSDRVIVTESITQLTTAIQGTGFVEASHSLADRPLGGSSSGGHCAWMDDDIRKVTKFFKTFPSSFKNFEDDYKKILDSDSTKTNTEQLNKITQLMQTIHDSMSSMQSEIDTSNSLLLKIASESSLEAMLDE